MAEEYFNRLHRAEIGHHHHIAGAYLLWYAQEAAWREDNRRNANGEGPARRRQRLEAETVCRFHWLLAASQSGITKHNLCGAILFACKTSFEVDYFSRL
ncbi:transposase [Mesorhizobium sp. B2-6-2]|uniref:transposase n=1 Tax=Mesorhizobium sp. B2-6-2 TaxID=2589915 RepID=UPI00112652DF|nr:transposase [Mesorhizobium sp. B2-6-2]TPJ80944.1 transposase [Mesorhizobium sp. B2-6-2]